MWKELKYKRKYILDIEAKLKYVLINIQDKIFHKNKAFEWTSPDENIL